MSLSPKTDEQLDAELAMFGMRKLGDEWVPVLKRHAKGLDACPGCNGFGTYGMPLCGAVYACDKCEGDGKRRGVPTVWERVRFWWKGLFKRG
jgi:hypothetical protein